MLTTRRYKRDLFQSITTSNDTLPVPRIVYQGATGALQRWQMVPGHSGQRLELVRTSQHEGEVPDSFQSRNLFLTQSGVAKAWKWLIAHTQAPPGMCSGT